MSGAEVTGITLRVPQRETSSEKTQGEEAAGSLHHTTHGVFFLKKDMGKLSPCPAPGLLSRIDIGGAVGPWPFHTLS